ncbi:MAG: 16S rRNA (adenine(1518)-N(6)/adenine(1519)-N(6))-dimethyltransferase RsmA [Terriglobales bacterium]
MARASRVNAEQGRRPKLGQNFLADANAAARIVDALGDLASATVLEIGPGRGALTSLLADRAGRVVAIEVDRVLAAQLGMHLAKRKNVEVIEGDVLAIDLSTLITLQPGDLVPRLAAPSKAYVVGNLPYYITSPILMRLFRFAGLIEKIVITVQREVAERIAARPGSRDYGVLSAATQLYTRVEKLFTLPPGAFSPAPKVHSAVLRLKVAPRAEALGVPADEFIEFLKLCFAQKRKTLANNLKAAHGEDAVRRALAAAGVRRDGRAEALTLEQTAAVFRTLRA